MKKVLLGLMLLMGTSAAFGGNDSNEEVVVGEKITILNDTDEELRVHTGYGETTLSARGGKTSVTCSPGKDVKVEGEVVFEVTDDMCGETIKLSDYL